MLKLKDIIKYMDTDDIELYHTSQTQVFEQAYNEKYNEYFIDFIHASDSFNKITIQIKEKE